MERIFQTDESFLDYNPDFLPQTKSISLFETLKNDLNWIQSEIVMFGKKVLIPRKECFLANSGESYSYSGNVMKSSPWPMEIEKIHEGLNEVLGMKFNSCLANFYSDGKDSNGWHSDNEKELGSTPQIASISLGGTRKFQFRRKQQGSEIHSIDLVTGSLLFMGGEFQRDFKHCIPKTAKLVEPRINLTFRQIINKKDHSFLDQAILTISY